MAFKILIVDDEDDFRDLVSLFLRKEAYEIRNARSGHEAFSQFQQWHPDLVITDIRMPDGDGIELMQDIARESAHFPPILVMTGHPGPDETEIRNNPNFAGFLSKPVPIENLLSSIRSILNQSTHHH